MPQIGPSRSPAPWSDFIEDFLEFTDGVLSPDIFRKWSAISLLGGALERRVWITTGMLQAFPNLYTLLVAPPGVGKQVIDKVRDLWEDTLDPGNKQPIFKVAPDSMSKASLMDRLEKSVRHPPLWVSGQAKFHSLLIAAEEFGVLMPSYDMEYIGVLNKIFNNGRSHREERRHGKPPFVEILQPQLNILGGTQPGWLASTFPEEAWTTGLTSRMIMVYQSERTPQDIFYISADPEGAREKVLASLGALSNCYGGVQMEPAAEARMRDWCMSGCPPSPKHSKLANYSVRRPLHLNKLALIAAVSRQGPSCSSVALEDLERAMRWLFDAEALMPDIFRAMIGKSDSQVLEELHFMMLSAWVSRGRKPLPERVLYAFLAERVPSDKIERLLQVAERSSMMEKVGDCWVPKPKHEHGVE